MSEKLFKCVGDCQQMLPRSAFYVHNSRSTGLQSHCKDCHKKRVKYQRNKHIKEIKMKPYVLDLKMMNYTKNR